MLSAKVFCPRNSRARLFSFPIPRSDNAHGLGLAAIHLLLGRAIFGSISEESKYSIGSFTQASEKIEIFDSSGQKE